MTADLGGKVIRVFLGWPGVTLVPEGGGRYDIAQAVWKAAHKDFSEEQTWGVVRQSLEEAANSRRFRRHSGSAEPPAGDQGLRRHPAHGQRSGIAALENLLRCAAGAHFGRAGVRKAVNEVGSLQTIWHYGGEYDRGPDGIKVKGDEKGCGGNARLLDIGYRAIAGFELCHPLPVVNGKTVGLNFVDKNAQLAAEYMRGILARRRSNAP